MWVRPGRSHGMRRPAFTSRPERRERQNLQCVPKVPMVQRSDQGLAEVGWQIVAVGREGANAASTASWFRFVAQIRFGASLDSELKSDSKLMVW